jgi:hypothetical protein
VKSNVLSEDDSFNLGTRKTREIVQPQRELSTDEYLEEEKKLVKDEDEGYNDEGNTKENFASFVMLKRMDDFKQVSKTLFSSMNQFNDVATTYVIDNEKYMKFIRNDTIR